MEEARRRTLHGRRRGKKLRVGQQSLLDTLLPRLALALPAEPQKIDLARLFGGRLPPDGVWLEIGFGAGEHLVWQAEQHPDVGLIGCEPYLNGVAKCLAHIERTGVGNIRLFTDDARLGSWRRCPTARLPASSCCSPTRGPRRGITSGASCSARPSTGWPSSWSRARSWLATDDPSYLPWMIEHACTHPAFEWLAEGPADWRGRPADWPATRYEKKRLAGTPTFLRLRRRSA